MLNKLKFNSKKKKSVNEKYEEVYEYSVELIHHSKLIELLSIKDNISEYINEYNIKHKLINPKGNDDSIILHKSNNSEFRLYIDRNILGNTPLTTSILVFKVITNNKLAVLQIINRNSNISIIEDDNDTYYVSGSYSDFYLLDTNTTNPIIPIIKSIVDPDIFIRNYMIDYNFDSKLSGQIKLLDHYFFDEDTKLKDLHYIIIYIDGKERSLIRDVIFNYTNKLIYFDKKTKGVVVYIKLLDLYTIYKNLPNEDSKIIIGNFLDRIKFDNYTINYSDNNIEDNDQYYENIDEILD